MKKIYTLLALFCLSCSLSNAQLIVKEDSTVTDTIREGDLEWYRIITPVSGQLQIITSAYVNASGTPNEFQFLGLEVLGRNNNINFGTFFPNVGSGGVPLTDTLYTTGGTAGLAADTFYFRFDVSLITDSIWTYTFRWHIIPATYPVSAQPDSFPGAPQPLPYNTNVTGNLGYNDGLRSGEDGTNEWMITPPMDGTLKVSISAEALNGNYLVLQPYDSKRNGLVAQYPSAGLFHAPLDTTLYWDCISSDTFYLIPSLNTFGDAGYSYRMSYMIVPPVYNDDIEPNNSFAQPQVVDPTKPIEGHLSFYGEPDDDYFKFYKPDSGFLQIQTLIETATSPGVGAFMYVNVYDSAQNDIYNFYPYIGNNSQPVMTDGYIANLPPGWYYILAAASSVCTSYRFDISTPTISGVRQVSSSIPLNIFPNPSSGAFTIDLGNEKNTTVCIYNSIGQLIQTIIQKNERYVQVGMELPAGLYLINARNENGEIVSQGKLAKVN